MRRTSAAVVLSTLVMLLWASPADAHAVFVGGTSAFPVDTDQDLAMNVPHERDDGIYNVEVTIAMPEGWQPLTCQPKDTWTCDLSMLDGREVIHFAKSAGSLPAEDETFRFAVHTATTVGSFPFPTLQKYSSGEIVGWIGPPGSADPAPVLQTIASANTSPPTTPTTPPTDPTAGPTTGAPAPPTTSAPATTITSGSTPATPEPTTNPTTIPTATTTAVPTSTTTTMAPISTPTTVLASLNETSGNRDAGGGSSVPWIVGSVVVVLLAAVGATFAYLRWRHRPTIPTNREGV